MLGTGSVARPLVGALPSGRLSAINRNQLPGDKARIVRREEHHDGRQILGSIAVGLPERNGFCLLYTSPSPRDATLSRMPSSA